MELLCRVKCLQISLKLLLIIYFIIRNEYSNFQTKKLNELGDFCHMPSVNRTLGRIYAEYAKAILQL